MTVVVNFHRFRTTNRSTTGLVMIDGIFLCFCLEDAPQEVKIPGKTAIPAGLYEVKLRPELTPKTEAYQKKYPFFTRHLHLQDVPGFSNIYCHVGNTPGNTDGCLLVGMTCGGDFIGKSAIAYEKLYRFCQPKLLRNERVFFEVTDQVLGY